MKLYPQRKSLIIDISPDYLTQFPTDPDISISGYSVSGNDRRTGVFFKGNNHVFLEPELFKEPTETNNARIISVEAVQCKKINHKGGRYVSQ